MRAGRENFWHSDASSRATPPALILVRALEVPPAGGDSLFCNVETLYEELPGAVKAQIQDLQCLHDPFAPYQELEPSARFGHLADYPEMLHPVVGLHPRTGRKFLYVNEVSSRRLLDLDYDQGRMLLDYLLQRVRSPEHQCRFKWRPDWIALWDNLSCQHYGASDYYPARRVMERIQVMAPEPGARAICGAGAYRDGRHV